jgi:hypothetical protein
VRGKEDVYQERAWMSSWVSGWFFNKICYLLSPTGNYQSGDIVARLLFHLLLGDDTLLVLNR